MNNSQIEAVILTVSELPDRDSPEDHPEMMLVSADELREILEEVTPVQEPAGWRDFLVRLSEMEGSMVNGNRLSLAAKELLAK